MTSGGKWEDEEERRFFEDVQDLKDFVPKSVLGVESDEAADGESTHAGGDEESEKERIEREKEEVRKLEEELEGLKMTQEAKENGISANGNSIEGLEATRSEEAKEEEEE